MPDKNVPRVVNYHRVWSRLPNIASVLEMPKTPVQVEEYRVDYKEDQLRNMIVENTGMIGDMVVDAATVQSLPDNYVSELYANTRFGISIAGELMPIRLGDAFTSSPYALPNYFLMSALLHAVYQAESKTTNPENLWRLDNGLRLLRQINFVMSQILESNPSGIRPAQPVVSAYTEIYTNADYVETNHMVMIDRLELTVLEADGWTAQSVADHWVNNKTQPV